LLMRATIMELRLSAQRCMHGYRYGTNMKNLCHPVG
jgi:hypothetical protein